MREEEKALADRSFEEWERGRLSEKEYAAWRAVNMQLAPVWLERCRSAFDAAWNARGELAEKEIAELRAKGQIAYWQARCETLTRDLAECYRLSGADPDGDEDWRLAPRAVAAVRQLRADYDQACDEAWNYACAKRCATNTEEK